MIKPLRADFTKLCILAGMLQMTGAVSNLKLYEEIEKKVISPFAHGISLMSLSQVIYSLLARAEAVLED